MNILLINHYAGSPDLGMEFRPYYMAREWVKSGHRVLIIGATYSHLRRIQPDKGRQHVDGIDYYWVKTNVYKGNGLGRVYSMFLFVFKLMFCLRNVCRSFDPDLVIASSTYPLDIYPAKKIAKKYHAKLVYEVHDLWPLSPMEVGGYSKWHPFIQVMQWAENYAYKNADKVISFLWNSEQYMREHGLAKGKFKCIPNGYRKEDWEGPVFLKNLPEEHRVLFGQLEDKVIVGFAGGFAASGSLHTLIQAAATLHEHAALAFVLVGRGVEEDTLKGMVKEKGLQNVYFLPSVEKKHIPLINSRFDIAFMGGVHSCLHKYGTSYNKLTDYMLSSKPIVQAIDEPGSLVERIRCGIRVEAENPEQVADAIIKIANMSFEERRIMGERGRKYAIENLEWNSLANAFIAEVE